MTVTNGNTAARAAPFDLDARRAARAEAAGEPFEFTFAGDLYQVAPLTGWPIDVMDHIGVGDFSGALRPLLTAGTFEALAAAGATMADLVELFEEIGRWAGVGGLGNSAPSPRPASTPT